MYTSLDAIDQGHVSTAGFVKTAGRKRLLDWYHNLSAEYHAHKPRLDGKGNGAMAVRIQDTSSSLEQRGLEIGRKDFRTKRKRVKVQHADANERRRYQARQSIYDRLLQKASTVDTSEKTSLDNATRLYMQSICRNWKQYYTTSTQKGKQLRGICWIGAPVLHHEKQAVLCGESRKAWRLFRLDTASLVHVPKTQLLQVELPNEDDGTVQRLHISL